MRKNHQQKENTTYIDGFTVLFFDGMSKERKKYKRDKVQSVKDWKNTKKYKNTNCIFGCNGKIQKKYKNTKCICSYFICNIFRIFFVFLQKKIRIFFVFLQKKYEKNTKNTTLYIVIY